MAEYKFKIEDHEIALEKLEACHLRDAFQDLKERISEHLQSTSCSLHGREPIVVLQSRKNNVTLAGFGTCCEEFGAKVEALLGGIKGITGANSSGATRRLQYTHTE